MALNFTATNARGDTVATHEVGPTEARMLLRLLGFDSEEYGWAGSAAGPMFARRAHRAHQATQIRPIPTLPTLTVEAERLAGLGEKAQESGGHIHWGN